METKIIAAWCGTGKSFICERTNLNAIEIEYWKYKERMLQNAYIKEVKRQMGTVEYILISTEPDGLRLLCNHGIEIILVYPEKGLRNEYLDRYIDRDSPYEFIGTFMKHWDIWIDELKEQDYCSHTILKSGEYLQNVLNGFEKAKVRAGKLKTVNHSNDSNEERQQYIISDVVEPCFDKFCDVEDMPNGGGKCKNCGTEYEI